MTQPEKKKRRILLIELPNFKETVEQWLTSIQSEMSQKKLDALKGMINDAEMRILLGKYEDSLAIYEKGPYWIGKIYYNVHALIKQIINILKKIFTQ